MLRLTPQQIQFFKDQGYLTLEALAEPREVSEMKAVFEKLFATKTGKNEGAYGEMIATSHEEHEPNSPQLLNPVNYASQLHDTKCFQNALQVAQQLLGNEARFFFDNSILKKPKIGEGTPWHQDAAFRDPRFEYKEVSIWVPLQDVDAKSSCLRFIPGSHKNIILEHHSVNDDVTAQALECTGPFDESVAVACPLSAGGCTIHDPATLHCSGPNLSETPRFAYIMVFRILPKLAKQERIFPWLELMENPVQATKRRWMMRGGLFITLWRKLRRGELLSWSWVVYWSKRSMRILRYRRY
jgi:ectoine hydroxylase-related dioxygenase (phytanoyl-CoA dioxygenase family)